MTVIKFPYFAFWVVYRYDFGFYFDVPEISLTLLLLSFMGDAYLRLLNITQVIYLIQSTFHLILGLIKDLNIIYSPFKAVSSYLHITIYAQPQIPTTIHSSNH